MVRTSTRNRTVVGDNAKSAVAAVSPIIAKHEVTTHGANRCQLNSMANATNDAVPRNDFKAIDGT